MPYADKIITSNAVFTGLEDRVFKGGVAITGNQISAVGSLDDMKPWRGPATEMYEYGDQMIMPGFIDAHIHFIMGAFFNSPYMLSLFDSRSEEDCVRMAKEFAARHPDLDKISGMGWLPTFWDDHETMPSRKSLDDAFPDKAVFLLAADGHTFWLNGRALELSGVTNETQVSFGKIGRDETGELNGLLFEIEAESAAIDKAFSLPEDQFKEILKNFLKTLSSYGVTSVGSMSVSPAYEESNALFCSILSGFEKDGDLLARVHHFPSLGLNCEVAEANRLRGQYHSDMLRISGVKHFIDGVTSTYTGFLLEPYGDRPEITGEANYPKEFYKRGVIEANKNGFSVRLHAIGDAAVRLALDVFEESGRHNDTASLRNGIEHIESIHADDIPRFQENGVIASVQPTHLVFDTNEKLDRLGLERCRYEWPFKSLNDSGAVLAYGTDFPVAAIDPMPGVYASVTRCDYSGAPTGFNPQEKLPLFETLKAYTYGGAYSIGREHELGTLETGKLADIIVLNRDLYSAADPEILGTHVELTILNGKTVYKSTGL